MPAVTFDGSQKVDYRKKQTPTTYACEQCGMTGVKLWRNGDRHVSQVTLRCQTHRTDEHHHPAILSEDNLQFLAPGYLPKNAARWWEKLPLR